MPCTRAIPEVADPSLTNDLWEAWLFDPFPSFVDGLPGPPASDIELGCDGTPEGCGILARALAILAGLGLVSSAWRLPVCCEVDHDPKHPFCGYLSDLVQPSDISSRAQV